MENKGQNIAYIRVSTIEQNEERQVEALKNKNISKYYIEKVSGKDTNRPKLQEMLEYVREGDTIYIHDFSRLARNVKDLLNIVEKLQNKGVNLVSLKENLDLNTPAGKLQLTMLGAIYEFEREMIKERQAEGIAIAKAKGKYKGRKKIEFPSNWEEIYTQWKNREITSNKAMELLSLKRNTFYNLIKEYECERLTII